MRRPGTFLLPDEVTVHEDLFAEYGSSSVELADLRRGSWNARQLRWPRRRAANEFLLSRQSLRSSRLILDLPNTKWACNCFPDTQPQIAPCSNLRSAESNGTIAFFLPCRERRQPPPRQYLMTNLSGRPSAKVRRLFLSLIAGGGRVSPAVYCPSAINTSEVGIVSRLWL